MKTLAKWSVNDYHQMIAAGILGDRSVELLAGEIVEMSPQTPIHYNTTKRGANYLKELVADKADVRLRGPITLSSSEAEPDIAIVRLPESAYNERHPQAKDIFWLIEVADTSLQKDLEIKAAIYAEAGIPEYWVMYLGSKNVIVFREPQNGKYLTERTISVGVIIPLAFTDVHVHVEKLFS
ncbi:hypothetical protein B6N60_01290 [Richelia sinica FACHB-800]|uniref:Putative restriction endonuclease domain-containing protein n=1 Tax=Richelia sinica FACHB-800 TaxID=1357546 RepID=A0A975Y3Y0_9NOST|nr:Uma2 family endonuclease [Richelia sinica]MBD2664178.1 Uma2 family endonuclease [Richelia sinica FACHB-800]QXE22605.1 hypothetical protein B6N60_01290 [Richelia sinica FACHB-800]